MMTPHFAIRALPLLALLMLAACSHGRSAGEAADSADADSAEAAAPAVLTPLPEFPDTVYPSASAVSYTVEIADASIDPAIGTTADMYANTPGAFTFRANAHRDADFGGRLDSVPSRVEVDWTFRTSSSPKWGGGSGWTGQPLYVEWPDSCIERFRKAGVVNECFTGREIIVGSLSGNIYFLDFDTGKPTRQPIVHANPIKGTLSLDPTLNGNLYAGQGIPHERPFGAFMVNLYTHQVAHFTPEDPKALRQWGAYDSSPARAGRFLLRPGENGTLYKLLIEPGKLTLQSALRYKAGGLASGMEASCGICSNYVYTADNTGNILCTNINTMRPVWHYLLGDDTDHSLIVMLEDGGTHPYVYTGSEVDKQGQGTARFVKLDGLTGQPVWRIEVPGRLARVGEKHFDGGFYATSLPGRGDCDGLLITSCVLNTSGQNGQLMALSRADGHTVWTTPLKYYGWSSPVGLLGPSGEQYVFAADCSGNVYLLRGADGSVIYTARVGNNFESSPVVVGSSLVVGSRGDTIYKLSIR